MDKQIIGDNNNIRALSLISDFGWLRAPELSVFMWPKSKPKTRLANAAELVRKMDKEGFLILRKLPKNVGFALMLSEGGARLLREKDISAQSGKNIGKLEDGQWTEPPTWEHDLKACGLLAILSKSGYVVLGEKKIKRENPSLTKIPDGVFYRPGEEAVYWLEVENARKAGPNMEIMAKSLMLVVSNHIKVSGLKVNVAALAFDPNSVSEKGRPIDHQDKVEDGLQKFLEEDIEITFFKLKMRGAGVASFDAYKKIVEADATNVLLNKIKFSHNNDGEHSANFGEFRMKIVAVEGKFKWRVKEFADLDSSRVEQFKNIIKGENNTMLEAKRACILTYRSATENVEMGME